MPAWNPQQYLKFANERTQPCRDLVARIELDQPRCIVDLGCGPGNSTAVLAQRWPDADLTGIDRSAEMIRAARATLAGVDWREGDIGDWSTDGLFDLVFSNAALQWIPDHARVIPHLVAQVAPGGALAFQVPASINAPAHLLMRELAASASWRPRFTQVPREWFVEELPFYYDLLAPHAARLDLWRTEYFHLMDSPASIVEWYKGTGLQPFMDCLSNPQDQEEFAADYLREIEQAYPRQPDGRVLFPFLRLFVIAYQK